MESYADALLRFAHVVVRRAPASTEVFTLGTRLTRVTRELRLRDPEHALAAAGRSIPDWSGGTRLGEVLAAFVDRWGRRGAARRAVVVIFSDGWERGDTNPAGRPARAAAPAGAPAGLGEPARRQGRLRAGAGRDRRRPAAPGRPAGRAQPGHAGGSAGGDGTCVTWWTSSPAGGPTTRRVALATVVGTYRSAPRQPGASMLVGPDGEAVGSVSGGCVEGAVYELGEQVRADGRPVLQRYGVSDDDAFAVGLTCGGIIDLFVEKVDRADVPAARRGRRGDREGAAGRGGHGRLRPAAAARHPAGRLAGPGRRQHRLRAPGRRGPRRRARPARRGPQRARCTTASTGSAAARASTSSSSRSPRRRG